MAGEDSRRGGPWIRFEPPLLPGAGVLERLMAAGRPGDRATAIEFLDRGVVNSNYRVTTVGPDGQPATPLLLRLSRSLAGADREAALAGRLAEVLPGLVARPVAALREDRPEPHAARLLEWIEGTPLDEAAPGGDAPELLPAARDLGHALRRLHAVRFDRYGRLTPALEVAVPRSGEPASDTFFGELAGRIHVRLENPAHGLDPERVEGLEALLGRLATRVGDVPGAASLVHGDLSPGNILLRREGPVWRLAGLIDWEMARASAPAADVASLRFEAGGRWPGFVAAALAAAEGDAPADPAPAGLPRTATSGLPPDGAPRADVDLALLLILLDARMVALVRRSEAHRTRIDTQIEALRQRHAEDE